jgi:hypothetical protein
VIAARQTDFCGPFILEPTINRLIEIGTLPQPTGEWTYEFPSLFELNPLEKAKFAHDEAAGILAISANAPETVADIDAFMDHHFPQYKIKEAAVAKQVARLKDLRKLDEGEKEEGEEGGEEGKKQPAFSLNEEE